MSSLHRIAECAVQTAGQGRIVTQIGPFRACMDPSTDLVWLNYVVPVWALGTPEETFEQLQRLRDLFLENHRTLRFEFVDGIWPGLPETLERFGLTLQVKVPIMICTPETLQPVKAAGIDVYEVTATDREAQRAFTVTQRESFAQEGDATPQELEQLRLQIEAGFWHPVVATRDGQPVGGGMLLPNGAIAELAGVGTLPSARRTGVAATLSTVLAEQHFAGGGDLLWLSAGSDVAEATYRKIGFTTAGVQWNYIDSLYSPNTERSTSEISPTVP